MRKALLACVASVAMVGTVACEDLNSPPAGDPVDLSYAPCVGSPDNPSWFAVQDGDGEWQRVNASATGSYDFTLSSGRGGIAMYHANDGLFVVYASTEEMQANLPSCDGGGVRSVSGTVTEYEALDNVILSMGSSNDSFRGADYPAPTQFLLSNVDEDVSDLVAVRYRFNDTDAEFFEAFPDNVFVRRNVTGTSTATVDFGSPTEAGAPLRRTLSVTNLVAGEALSSLSYVGLNTTMSNIAVYEASPTFTSGAATAPFYGIAGSRLMSGEIQMVSVGALKQNSSQSDESRFATMTFTDPTDRSFTLGPSLGAVTVSGGARPSATYTVQAAYDNLFDVVFSQGNGSSFRQVEVLATGGYLGGASGPVTLQVPDLSGVSGFSSSWLLATGVTANWTYLATDADMSLLNSRPQTYQGADRTNSFTP